MRTLIISEGLATLAFFTLLKSYELKLFPIVETINESSLRVGMTRPDQSQGFGDPATTLCLGRRQDQTFESEFSKSKFKRTCDRSSDESIKPSEWKRQKAVENQIPHQPWDLELFRDAGLYRDQDLAANSLELTTESVPQVRLSDSTHWPLATNSLSDAAIETSKHFREFNNPDVALSLGKKQTTGQHSVHGLMHSKGECSKDISCSAAPKKRPNSGKNQDENYSGATQDFLMEIHSFKKFSETHSDAAESHIGQNQIFSMQPEGELHIFNVIQDCREGVCIHGFQKSMDELCNHGSDFEIPVNSVFEDNNGPFPGNMSHKRAASDQAKMLSGDCKTSSAKFSKNKTKIRNSRNNNIAEKLCFSNSLKINGNLGCKDIFNNRRKNFDIILDSSDGMKIAQAEIHKGDLEKRINPEKIDYSSCFHTLEKIKPSNGPSLTISSLRQQSYQSKNLYPEEVLLDFIHKKNPNIYYLPFRFDSDSRRKILMGYYSKIQSEFFNVSINEDFPMDLRILPTRNEMKKYLLRKASRMGQQQINSLGLMDDLNSIMRLKDYSRVMKTKYKHKGKDLKTCVIILGRIAETLPLTINYIRVLFYAFPKLAADLNKRVKELQFEAFSFYKNICEKIFQAVFLESEKFNTARSVILEITKKNSLVETILLIWKSPTFYRHGGTCRALQTSKLFLLIWLKSHFDDFSMFVSKLPTEIRLTSNFAHLLNIVSFYLED